MRRKFRYLRIVLYHKRGIIIFVSIVSFCTIVFIRQTLLLKKYGRVTICEFVKYSSSDDGPKDADMKVYFKNSYSIVYVMAEEELKKRNRFFIKIVPGTPQMNDIYWNIPVPDTLKYIPDEGWATIPYNIEMITLLSSKK